MKIKYMLLILTLIVIVGCSGEVTVVNQNGNTDDTTSVDDTTSTDADNIVVVNGDSVDTDTDDDTTDNTDDDTTPVDSTNTSDTDNTTITDPTPAPIIPDHIIEIEEWEINPDDLTIDVGESVTWINKKPTGKRNSGAFLFEIRGECGDMPSAVHMVELLPGEEVTYTFDEVGTCTYKDNLQGEYAAKVRIE
ncbi:hypothetical protein ACFLZB_00230 [Nanoarchaeota archaeon]